MWTELLRVSLLSGFCLAFLLSAPRASALDPNRSVYQYNCQTWRRQNGLPANGVTAIAQTKDGYLWFGTVLGVVRFDGSEFKLIDMSHVAQFRSSVVTGLSASQSGGLWFGLERSAFGFCDGKEETFRGKEEWGGLAQNVHDILESPDGAVWVAAEGQSGRLTKDNSYETFPGIDTSDVTAVSQGSDGRIWLGTARKGLFYWQNGTLTKFPDDTLDERIIRALVEDKDRQIWVGTEMGLYCFDAHQKKRPLPFPWYETRALLADRHGVVWAGTTGGGLVRFVDGVAGPQFRQVDGLADDFINALKEDREGSLWIGTRNGLSQLSDVKIPTYGKTEGLGADVNISVSTSPRGGLWISTGTGFTHFSDGAVLTYGTNVGLLNPYIKETLEARNGDVYYIDGFLNVGVLSGGVVVTNYPNRSWPSAFTEDAQSVLVAISGELYRVGTNYLKPYVYAHDQKPSLSWVFNMICAHDDSVWIASSEGVGRLKDGAYTLYTKDDGLSDSKSICLAEDSDGTIWAGLESGIARIRNGHIRNITRHDGLFDNIIYGIVPDDHGSVWFSSSHGFFRVSRQNLNDFADGRATHVDCTAYDGMEDVKSFERNQQDPSGCKTVDGKIWFPTALGVVMIDPTNLATNPVPPPVYVHTVRANGRELSQAGAVRPGKGELEFYYAGLSYIAPQKIQYRYKLEGYDKDWVQAGTRRSAFYTNLKPGAYRFHVQACNADGVWGTTGADFAVELKPHFYQTALFIISMVLLTMLLLLGVYGWRVRSLERKQTRLQEAHDQLEAKVTARTAELAASNTSLKNEIEERKRIETEVERIHRQLVDASRLAGQAEVASSVLHNVGNVLNSVNVSTTLISERLQKLRLANLSKAAQLIQEHAGDLASFFQNDERGSRLPQYLLELAKHLGGEQKNLLTELGNLAHNVEHIKEIVAMQQTYAKISGAAEKVEASDLVESALKMHAAAYMRHSIKVVREYEQVPPIVVDRHKVLQILINIFQNAKYACDEAGLPDKKVTVRIQRCGDNRLVLEVADNGIGIAAENLTRIFSHGFTTRKNGHGFGLHSAVLAAKQMGGTLNARSDGVRKGATFTLDLPLSPPGTSTLEKPKAAPAVATV